MPTVSLPQVQSQVLGEGILPDPLTSPQLASRPQLAYPHFQQTEIRVLSMYSVCFIYEFISSFDKHKNYALLFLPLKFQS